MSERLERVERFEELREGMIVVVKPCNCCGGREHRSMLIGLRDWPHLKCDSPVWLGLPQGPVTGLVACRDCTVSAVNQGRLFRVLDGLEEPSAETAAASGTTRRTPQKERA